MAASTTALGMIPLLMDAFFVAMAVTIIFGLMFATLLTMIIVPVLYAIFYGASSDSAERTRGASTQREVAGGLEEQAVEQCDVHVLAFPRLIAMSQRRERCQGGVKACKVVSEEGRRFYRFAVRVAVE